MMAYRKKVLHVVGRKLLQTFLLIFDTEEMAHLQRTWFTFGTY